VGDLIFLGLHRGNSDDFIKQFDDAMRNVAETLAKFNLPLTNLTKVKYMA
jgi:hypothetical protein